MCYISSERLYIFSKMCVCIYMFTYNCDKYMNRKGRRKRVSERNRNRTNDQYIGYIHINIHIYVKRMFDMYTYIIATKRPLYIFAC